MKNSWKYAINTFLSATSDSFRLGLRISQYHLGALQSKIAIAVILALYNNYLLVHNSYNNAYTTWRVLWGKQLSKTQTVEKTLRKLSGTKIRKWDTAIQQVYDVDSDEYKALLPNLRNPFQEGTQTERKQAVKALSDAIGGDALLADVKTDVDAFYTEISNALTAQKNAISAVETASIACETARVLMCQEQYADLGALMQYYKLTPDSIETFFDLRVIRNGLQIIFTGQVKKNGVRKIVERTVQATDELLLENMGDTELRFYLSSTKDGVIGTTFKSVAAGAQLTVSASDLGDVTTQHFLMVFNPDTINKGEFIVDFL